jgi:hypothetical protein
VNRCIRRHAQGISARSRAVRLNIPEETMKSILARLGAAERMQTIALRRGIRDL